VFLFSIIRFKLTIVYKWFFVVLFIIFLYIISIFIRDSVYLKWKTDTQQTAG
jgi:hypothetical protein